MSTGEEMRVEEGMPEMSMQQTYRLILAKISIYFSVSLFQALPLDLTGLFLQP